MLQIKAELSTQSKQIINYNSNMAYYKKEKNIIKIIYECNIPCLSIQIQRCLSVLPQCGPQLVTWHVDAILVVYIAFSFHSNVSLIF